MREERGRSAELDELGSAPDVTKKLKATSSRRRRRPTGAPPPLPKQIGDTGKWWVTALAVFLLWVLIVVLIPEVRRQTYRFDTEILQLIASLRTAWLTDVLTAIDRLATGWGLTILAMMLLVLQMAFRRWRHLFTFVGAIAVAYLFGSFLYDAFARPRPFGITIIGRWAGFSMPSPPVAILAMVLMGYAYSMVPSGRRRQRAKIALAAILALVSFSRFYLGVDNPFDSLVGLVIGITVPLVAFRMFTPEDLVPVKYKTGKTAHLDVTGRRGEAIRDAVREQLGLEVQEIKPVGLEGSGGSTPLRLRVAGETNAYLFAKLYAMNHVRADRWYKLGREILYGRLEDEARFLTVRRFVESEDYTLRLLTEAEIPTAASRGIVEITPEREYMLVTDFIDGAKEIGDAEVDDVVVDRALRLIRRLWDFGLAHRDIKPANLLVREGEVYLIDAFFVQVRPSPWRQAVDLGNMLLVLALRSDVPRVYRHALKYFSPDDIAEAMAATRGVASPTQLRAFMKRDGRDLLAQFRALAPTRPPISLQRWSPRRVALALSVCIVLLLSASQIIGMFLPTHDLPIDRSPDCGVGNVMVLMAQSVPSATLLPCVASLPGGWHFGGVHVKRGRSTLWLKSDDGGSQAVEVTLEPGHECDVSDATPVPTNEAGTLRFEPPISIRPDLLTTRHYTFPGGCVTYRFAFTDEASPSLLFDVDQALAFQPRARIVEAVRKNAGLDLCGAGVPCPGGTGS
jgi:membrane-associated phospholipid phosphatase/tRNA A-37 threonylcarbamoyl transferase component Bud32